MSDSEQKVKLLNSLLAMETPFSAELFISATNGIEFALKEQRLESVNLKDFAKSIMRYYDSSVAVEVLEFGEGGHFDPLFAIPLISSAVKRLSGYKKSILIVSGMIETTKNATGRKSPNRIKRYESDLNFIEDYVMRYQSSFPNLKIIFI